MVTPAHITTSLQEVLRKHGKMTLNSASKRLHISCKVLFAIVENDHTFSYVRRRDSMLRDVEVCLVEAFTMSTALTIIPQGAIRLPDNDQWSERFEIRSSSSGNKYTIARNKKTGKYGCSCPGYLIAKEEKDANGKPTGRKIRYCHHLTKGCGLQLNQIHGNGLPAPPEKKPIRNTKAIGHATKKR